MIFNNASSRTRPTAAVNLHLFLFYRTISNRELLVHKFLERFLVGVLENTPRGSNGLTTPYVLNYPLEFVSVCVWNQILLMQTEHIMPVQYRPAIKKDEPLLIGLVKTGELCSAFHPVPGNAPC